MARREPPESKLRRGGFRPLLAAVMLLTVGVAGALVDGRPARPSGRGLGRGRAGVRRLDRSDRPARSDQLALYNILTTRQGCPEVMPSPTNGTTVADGIASPTPDVPEIKGGNTR